jgi:predicted nicotinamide N-methyase
MTNFLPQYISFKDNAARVVENDGLYYRYIFQEYKNEYEHLISSGLYKELVEKNLLIPHTEVNNETSNPTVYAILMPEQIPFISYPFEWSYSQWRKVLQSYLDINIISLKYGMVLKDASPYNFYLNKGNATMLDTSSFTFFKEPDYWTSYRQFCEEMLGPFALMHYNGQRWARLTQANQRGLPLGFISQNLPFFSRLNLTCLIHLHLHAKSQKEPESGNLNKSKGLSNEKLNELFHLLKSTINKWDQCLTYPNHWSNYYELDIETTEYLTDKESTVKSLIEFCKPKRVVDLGANTGMFSIIAAQYATQVIALEFDEICVDAIENQISKEQINNISTLLGDLSETTPDFGLLGKEHHAIIKRAKSDLVMALALVHHLALTKMIPFELISELLYEFSTRYVIVEFIEDSDRKVLQLMKNRNRFYPSKIQFEEIIKAKFNILNQRTLDKSARTVYLLEKC